MSRKKLIIIAVLAVALLLVFQVARKQYYKGQIEDMGIEFSEGGFYDAVQQGNAKAVEMFLKAGGQDKRLLQEMLINASGEGDVWLVRMLLEHGADADGESNGFTPLMAASARLRLPCFLLKKARIRK